MDILGTFLLPFGHEQLVASGFTLAPAPHPFEQTGGFKPGRLEFKADTLASADCSLAGLLRQVRILRALSAKVEMLEPHELIALTFDNPQRDPTGANFPGLSLYQRRLKTAERFTLFVELHPKLVESIVEEPLVTIHFSFDGGVLHALSKIGYADHLFGPPDIDDEAPWRPFGSSL